MLDQLVNGNCPTPIHRPEPVVRDLDYQQLEQHLEQAYAELRHLRNLLEKTLEGERAARYLASHDGLTSLANRLAFSERLARALERSSEQDSDLAVMFIDLDHFKVINDTHGHRVGDEVLAIVGSRLAKAVRAAKALRVADVVARLGGDEFGCLLMPAMSPSHLAQVALKLSDGIAAPMQVGSLRLQVSASIGIAIRRQGEALTAEQLLACADKAMYLAKQQQSRYCFAVECAGAAG